MRRSTYTPAALTARPSFSRRLVAGLAFSAVVAGSALAQTSGNTGGKSKAEAPASSSKNDDKAGKPAITVTLNAEQRAVLLRTLMQSDQHGFDRNVFAPPELERLLNSRNPDEVVRGQDMLVRGVIRYANAQHGVTTFRGGDWPKEWALRPQPYDAEKDFGFAVRQNRLQDWVNSLPPPFARYRALQAELVRIRTAPAEPAVQSAKSKRKHSKAAPAAKTGDRAAEGSVSVKLTRDQQIATLIANMVRWRWMPRNAPADRIEVNAAGGYLQVFQGGKEAMIMKVAAGKPGDETPMLSSTIDEITFNPVWHVPKSIAEEELYPKNKRNPGYFAKNGFEQSKTSESGLIQKPGPKNALGQVKFDFDNPFAVYLHDTPAQAAFERASRNVSHGCVRVEKPNDLALLLLQGSDLGSPQAIQRVIDKADTKTVKVAKPTAVYLLYFTAFVGPGGQVEYRKDVYDWDTKLLQLLAAGRETA